MVWFSCDYCGDTVKKPKLATHFSHCGSHSFNCVDCCQSFDRKGAQAHSVCLTEAQKYQLGATKPGGTHANGPAPQQQQPAASKSPSEPTGQEFLSVRPPWKCSVCNVSCTSQATLQSHAAGVKHKRRAKAALAAQNGGGAAPTTPDSNGAQPATAQQATEHQQEQQQQQQQEQQQQGQQQQEAQQAPASESAGEEKSSKKKKRQAPAASNEPDGKPDAAGASESERKKAKKAKKAKEASEPESEADAATASESGKKAKKREEPGSEDAATASRSGKKAKKRGEPDSEGDATTASESGKKAKKASESGHPSLPDDAALGALQKAVQKKIKAKGSIGPKKLGKLVASKLGLEASEQLVGAVRAELVKRIAGTEEQDGFLMTVS